MYFYYIALGLSVIMAFIAGSRYASFKPAYRPFALYLVISGAFDALGYIVSYYLSNNLLVSNIFVLIDPIFWLVIFYRWDLLARDRKPMFIIIGIFCFLFWLADIFAAGTILSGLSYYRIFYSFAIALLSINALNFQIVHDKINPLKSPRFLVAAGALIYFTNKVLMETFFIMQSRFSMDIMVIINFISKLIFLVAILWIPERPKKYTR